MNYWSWPAPFISNVLASKAIQSVCLIITVHVLKDLLWTVQSHLHPFKIIIQLLNLLQYLISQLNHHIVILTSYRLKWVVICKSKSIFVWNLKGIRNKELLSLTYGLKMERTVNSSQNNLSTKPILSWSIMVAFRVLFLILLSTTNPIKNRKSSLLGSSML